MDSVYAAAYPELYRKHWWWRVREEILLATVARLLAGQPRARILDVGCGAGLFFDALDRFGHVEGIESDRSAIDNAGRWKDRIHHGEFNESFVPAAGFDLILMLDVLEHLTAPVPLLLRASGHLRPGGAVLITVPAFNWLWTQHDDLNQHVRRYTARGVEDMVRAAGLSPNKPRYLFPSLVIPKAAVRIREALLGASPSVPAVPSEMMSRILQTVLRTEHALASWAPFGTSVLAVARHQEAVAR